jgi:predicted nuclease of predicted toxin-antitoxin system
MPTFRLLWLSQEFGLEAVSTERLNLLKANDTEIFQKAKENNAVILTKDSDFVDLVNAYGPPPMVVWISCGNTTNTKLKSILLTQWVRVSELLKQGHPIIELTDPMDR